MVQVGIVHEGGPVLTWLKATVRETPGFGVAWSAESGDAALSQHRARPADVLLFDIALSRANGPELIQQMMSIRSCGVLVVAADLASSRELLFALTGKSALDVVRTPSPGDGQSVVELRRKLIMLSRLLRFDARPKAASGEMSSLGPRAAEVADDGGAPLAIIGIGASTGGPQALAALLGALPAEFKATVVLVQHLDRVFLPKLQSWLQNECALPVLLAREGETLRSGTVLMADTEEHLLLESRGGSLRARYRTQPGHHAHTPSIDVFFASMAALTDVQRCGVLLTGMGRDGAQGLLALRQAGGLTLAQDEASSAVYGMPRAALSIGAVDQVLPLKQIPAHLLEFAQAAAVTVGRTS